MKVRGYLERVYIEQEGVKERKKGIKGKTQRKNRGKERKGEENKEESFYS